MKYKAILFDFDGTLANTTDVILAGFHEACTQIMGHDVTDKDIIKTFCLTLKAGMESLADKPEQVDSMRAIYTKGAKPKLSPIILLYKRRNIRP